MFLASLSAALVIVSELVVVLSLCLLDPINNIIHSLFHLSSLITELVLHVTRERGGLIIANSERITLCEVRDMSSLLNHHQIMGKLIRALSSSCKDLPPQSLIIGHPLRGSGEVSEIRAKT